MSISRETRTHTYTQAGRPAQLAGPDSTASLTLLGPRGEGTQRRAVRPRQGVYLAAVTVTRYNSVSACAASDLRAVLLFFNLFSQCRTEMYHMFASLGYTSPIPQIRPKLGQCRDVCTVA